MWHCQRGRALFTGSHNRGFPRHYIAKHLRVHGHPRLYEGGTPLIYETDLDWRSCMACCRLFYPPRSDHRRRRSEEHTSELQSLMRISYAVFCLKKKTKHKINYTITIYTNSTQR